jgi:YegS/Rv2252/BmrU family lipid kinase
VVSRLEEAGAQVEVRWTERPGHARELAAAAVAEGRPLVVACGGDGTLHDVANALAGTDTIFGLVPAGKANDLARELGLPHRPDAAAAVLLHGNPRRIDLGRVNDEYFCTVATLGFDAEVSRLVHENRIPFSSGLTYIYGVLYALCYYRCQSVQFNGDFGTLDETIFLTATANTPSYGGGMKIAPHAVVDDGRLSLCIIKEVRRSTVLRLFYRVFSGRHVTHPAVALQHAQSFTIDAPCPLWIYADGEALCQTPATVSVAPGALQVMVLDDVIRDMPSRPDAGAPEHTGS